MTDKAPSSGINKSDAGGGGSGSTSDNERLKVKNEKPLSEVASPPDAIARFVNNKGFDITVTVDYAYGGYSNARLRSGEYWDLNCRTSAPYDTWCWNASGPCTPNGSYQAIGGNTYSIPPY